MAITYTQNGIIFTLNADEDGIKTFINAVELNWNGAQLKMVQ